MSRRARFSGSLDLETECTGRVKGGGEREGGGVVCSSGSVYYTYYM
jgi:hypothetical protein